MKFDNILNGTCLDNSTLPVYGSGMNAHVRHYYTPHRIVLWNRGNYSMSVAESLVCHEYAHIVDWFQRDKARLLKPNYGFKGIQSEKWPYSALDNEIRTIAYQKNMVDFINKTEGASIHMDALLMFYKNFSAGRLMEFEDFKALFESYKEDIPGYFLIRKFNDAMKYIKAHQTTNEYV